MPCPFVTVDHYPEEAESRDCPGKYGRQVSDHGNAQCYGTAVQCFQPQTPGLQAECAASSGPEKAIEQKSGNEQIQEVKGVAVPWGVAEHPGDKSAGRDQYGDEQDRVVNHGAQSA